MSEKKNAFFQDMFKPFLVLVVICLVVAALLAWVNGLTAPVIADNAAKEAEANRMAVLPTATGFSEVDASAYAESGVTGIYADEGGAGYVITAEAYGYKGNVIVTVGFDAEGNVLDVIANVSTETVGIGTKAADPAYLGQFKGLSGSAGDVDTISGATYSTGAVRTAVNAAMAACEGIRG